MSTLRTDSNCANNEEVESVAVAVVPTGHDIDTIHLRLDEPIDSTVLRQHDKYEERFGHDSWLSSTAYIRNLRVTATESRVRIKGGLAAFTNGTNAAPFDLDDVLPALALLASKLGLPMETVLNAHVTRLDVGVNVPLSIPVSALTGAVAKHPTKRVLNYGTASTSLETTTWGLYIYDKRAERGQRAVDPVYREGPLVRVELRYRKAVSERLARPVTAGLLADREFYDELGRRLVEAASEVLFHRIVTIGGEHTSVRALRDAYTLGGIEASGGFDAAFASVTAASRDGRLKANQVYALRKWLRTVREAPGLTAPADIEAEFRRSVRAAVYGSAHRITDH